MEKQIINVKGMSCFHCKMSIENGLKQIGVEAKVNLEEKNVTVIYVQAQVQKEQIIKTIEDLGYEAVINSN